MKFRRHSALKTSPNIVLDLKRTSNLNNHYSGLKLKIEKIMTMKRKIIIDCDPGQDDAINLFLAFASRDILDILGIVAVAGNVSLEKTERNTRILCELTKTTDIPVYAGHHTPLKYPLATAEEVFGEEGLDGVEIYEPSLQLQTQDGVEFIVETLLASKDSSVTLVPTGPLTNIAAAIQASPEIIPKIKEIVLMGGALREGGNITPSAEFNIYVDPHAAQIVFDSGCKIVAFGLDATHQVLSSKAALDRIKAIGNSVSDAAYELLTCYSRFDSNKYGTDGAPLHDPCTIAYLIEPELFKLKECNISVSADCEIARGHTAVDFWYATEKPRNSQWCYYVDCEGFFDLLVEKLKFYSPKI